MSKNRIGQWFVDATDPTKWYGPVLRTKGSGLEYVCQNDAQGYPVEICEAQIAAGNLVRIPPRPDLPPGLTTRECRLPKKGERYVDLNGKIRSAPMPYSDGLIGDYGWRRWILEAEPEEAQKEIDRLTRELAEARAALVRAERLAYEAYQPQVEAAQAAALLAAMKGETK